MIRTELTLRLPNSPGALASVCRALADDHINIIAMSLEAGGSLRLVVDNHLRAAAALEERHHRVSTRDVLLVTVPGSSGGLAPVLRLVSEAGVNVEYAYAAAAEGSAAAAAVLGVEDARRAATAAGM
jgi:hypothetical protein